jgi:hypothetical protein
MNRKANRVSLLTAFLSISAKNPTANCAGNLLKKMNAGTLLFQSSKKLLKKGFMLQATSAPRPIDI